jgi:hypothetical protein
MCQNHNLGCFPPVRPEFQKLLDDGTAQKEFEYIVSHRSPELQAAIYAMDMTTIQWTTNEEGIPKNFKWFDFTETPDTGDSHEPAR